MLRGRFARKLARRVKIAGVLGALVLALPCVVLAQEAGDTESPQNAGQDFDLGGAWTLNDSCYWYTSLQGTVTNVSVAPCFTAGLRLSQTGDVVRAEVRDRWACAENGPRLLPAGAAPTGNMVAYDLVLQVAVQDDRARGEHVICEWGTDKKPRVATEHVELSISPDGNSLIGTWHSSEVDKEIPIVLTRDV